MNTYYLQQLDDYYYEVWSQDPQKYIGKTEEELKQMILLQIDDETKEKENFVIFAFISLITKDFQSYGVDPKFKRLYWLLIRYDDENYTNYWEYEDLRAYAA